MKGEAVGASGPAPADLDGLVGARLGSRAIAMAGLVVVAGVVLSRILGWVRVAVITAQFGVDSSSLAAFWAAFRIPDLLFQLVAAGALGSALVPVMSGLLAAGDAERARRLVSTVANLMILALLPLAVLMWLLAPLLVPALFPISDSSKLGLEIELTRWMLLSPVLLAMAAAMTAGLNAAGIFGAPSLAPNVYNLAIIACALALTPLLGIYALAAGVVLGAAGHVATQLPAVMRNRLYRPVLVVRDPAVRETLLLMAPRALGLGATQIVFVVNTFFAVQVDAGLPVYTLAFTALQIPIGLIGVPLGIVLLPPLSRAMGMGDMDRFRRLVDQSLRQLLYVSLPLMALMIVLARPTLVLLFQYGKVDAAGTDATVPVLLAFLLGLVAHVLITLLAPIFYSGKDTRTPVAAALVAVAVDVAAAALLFPALQLVGLALAIGLGAWAEVSLLLFFLRRRGWLQTGPLLRTGLLVLPGAALAGAAALVVDRLVALLVGESPALPVVAADLVFAGLAGAACYLAWSRLLRLEELSMSVHLVRLVLRRD